ncbi:MAG: nucleoside-triphosphatase, partial [Planctomycetes bacterium]|nr:nucleoside-triphosphatase [Planctomycetota bacterium]
RTATLASVHSPSRHRVSKYGVDLEAIDGVGAPAIERATATAALVVIDEIGKMECCSRVFAEAVTRALDSSVAVLATIAAKGGGFIEQVKRRADVEIMPVSPGNRDALPELIIPRLLCRLR